MSQSALIVRFLLDLAPNPQGRTRRQMLAWSDDRLERQHDYIQWLFPLPEPSAFNPNAPVLNEPDMASLCASRDLPEKLRESLDRMLAFYGMRHEADAIVPGADFERRAEGWLVPANHNLLRLTRILRCLTVLGQPDLAAQLLACLEALRRTGPAASIPQSTFDYWRGAVGASSSPGSIHLR